jgi:hypothetical protein
MKKTNILYISLAVILIIIVVFIASKGITINNLNNLGTNNNSTTTHNTVSNQTSGLKAPMHGLVSMGNIKFFNIPNGIPDNSLDDIYARPQSFDGVVLNINWSQLEATQGNFDSSVIDKALDDILAYNSKYPDKPLSIRLDVFAGTHAPDWAKNIGGSPITINKNIGAETSKKKVKVTIGRFWTKEFEQRWTELQNFLASKYDSEPLIHEVSFNSCTSIDDEPFRDNFNDAETVSNLHNAGFTDQLFKNCLIGSFDDYSGWKNTYVAYPFNIFFNTDSGKPVADADFTIQTMEAWKKYMGNRGVISYHSLGSPIQGERQKLYDELKKIGPIIEFQLYSSQTIYVSAVAEGVSYGATAIEVWDTPPNFSFMGYDNSTLQKLSAEINKNSQTLNNTGTPITYKNTDYGFTFSLPNDWAGYSIVNTKWQGNFVDNSNKPAIDGPEILIRNPLWTSTTPRQDIPIMIFTLDQWSLIQQEKLSLGAAPIGPSELGRNSKYIFALPARYNFSYLTGFEEVQNIIDSKPLHTSN